MKSITPITVAEYDALLKKKGNAVPWEDKHKPKPLSDLQAFIGVLEESDVDRIFFWHEHRVHTSNDTAKLTDSSPAAREKSPRVSSFIDGVPKKGRGPADLRATPDLEPMMITGEILAGPLLTIDGNHRLIAQRISGKAFEGTRVYVCQHPLMMQHNYMFMVRDWLAAQADAQPRS